MSGQEADADVLGRQFLAIATGQYDSPVWGNLPVEDEVAALRAWLCAAELDDRRFTDTRALASNPGRDRIRTVLEDVPWRASEAAVVFITGHGEYADGAHWIVLKSTVPGQWHRTAIRTADVIGWLKDSGTEHLLLIIDLCYAGRVTAQIAVFDDDIPPTWLVLPSAAKGQEAVPGALTGAVSKVLADLTSPRGERFGRHNRLLSVETFLEALQEELGAGQRLIPLPGSLLRGPHPCLPNPHYRPEEQASLAGALRDLALPQADVDAHWGPRSRGVAQDGDPGWFFTGRAQVMRDLIAAVLREHETVMLTGGAGTGKSAVLARLVTLSDPTFLAGHREHIDRIPGDLRPPPGMVDVAVLATGKTASEIAEQISSALGIGTRLRFGADPHLKEWTRRWQEWLIRRRTPVTLVIDAIEEADDPGALIRHLLTKLHVGRGTQLRLLLGVRSPGRSERRLSASSHRDVSLADRIEKELNARRIRVDEEPWFDQEDLAAYASQILTETPGSPYARSADQAAATAKALAAHAKRSFLVTRIAAASLARDTRQVAPDDTEWLSAVDNGVRGVFSADLHQLLRDPDERLRGIHLLRALAFARGNGLPWNRLWPAVADCLAGDPEITFGDSDIAGLLASPLGGYLTVDVADDTTVYRLFHDSLRTTLRSYWRELWSAEQPAEDTADETRAAEAGIAEVLAHSAHRTLDVPGSAPVAPYIRRHLAEHAAAGDVLDDRLLAPRLLPYLDIARLRPLLNTAPTAAGLTTATALRRLAHVWDFARVQENAIALTVFSAALGTPLAAGSTDSPWHVLAAHWPLRSTEVLGRHRGPVRASAGLVLPDGRALALTAGVDETVRVWDLGTGQPAKPPLVVNGVAVVALSTVLLSDGRPLALVTDEAGTVQAWDLSDGQPAFRSVAGHEQAPLAGLVLPDGRVLALTRGAGGTACVWDLEKGTPALPLLKGHRGVVRSVAGAVLPDERAVALTGGDGGVVRVWDLADGVQVTPPLNVPSWTVRVLAGPVVAGGRRLALAVGGGGKVWVWDISTGEQAFPPLAGHQGRVLAMSCVALPGGRALALTGGADGTVQAWDLADGRPALPPLTEYHEEVRALSGVVLPDGRALAVTGDQSGTVRMWDLADGRPTQPPLTEQDEGVRALSGVVLPDGRALAVTGDQSGRVRFWDLATGRLARPPLDGPPGAVQAVTGFVSADGRARALSCDSEGTLWDWDLGHGQGTARARTDHDRSHVQNVAALVLPDDRTLAVTAGGDGKVRAWDLTTGQRICVGVTSRIRRNTAVVTGLVFPDGRAHIVCGGRGMLQLWGLSDGRCAQLDTGDERTISALAAVALPDGRALAVTGGSDGTVRVWDLRTGGQVGSVINAPGPVTALSATALGDGRLVVVIGGEGTACVIATHP
ncbi:hypothetical protein [Streptomyces sp. Tue6028]|uniref:hypothetical protein n=1 Tax=Streptomyces sp. Tue6028 TaxID=2036037 RepID=UPI003D708136